MHLIEYGAKVLWQTISNEAKETTTRESFCAVVTVEPNIAVELGGTVEEMAVANVNWSSDRAIGFGCLPMVAAACARAANRNFSGRVLSLRTARADSGSPRTDALS